MGAFFGSIARFLYSLVSTRLFDLQFRFKLVALYIAVYVSFVLALAAGFKSLFASVVTSVPSNSLVSAGLSLIPANAGVCISAIGSAYGLSQLYIWKQRLLKAKVDIK